MLTLGSDKITSSLLSRLGKKASALHELKLAGFPVPPGIIISDFTEVDYSQYIHLLGGYPVAVRSSGTMEDLANASFAGLYETYLNVKNALELNECVKKCFESRNSERVKDYLDTKKISWNEESLKMSVLVQKMVDAKIAGVLFTLNPLNGREEEMYLELCEGVGERLVSGHVTPTQITFNWLQNQKIKETINSENSLISDKQLNELIHLALRIQAHYGTPQDIEWAVGADDKVYILQSRPITTFSPRTDTPELTNADFKDGGVSARVCTPFMYSVYREALNSSMGGYFKKIHLISNDEHIQWIHYHYGRVFWNAEAVKEGLKKLPGFKEESFDRDLGLQKDYGEAGSWETPLSVAGVIEAIPVLLGLHREFSDCENMIRGFREKFEVQDQNLKKKLRKLNQLSDVDFRNWFMEVIIFQHQTEKNYFRTIYNNSNFQTEFKTFLKKLPAYQEGDEIDLMGELHGVSHLDVQKGLEELKIIMESDGSHSQNYFNAREAFLNIHYHHGPAELDLLVPRWGERTDWIDELVINLNFTSRGPQKRYAETMNRHLMSLGFFKRSRFTSLTDRSRNFLRLREEMRSYSTRAYYLLRLGLLEFARRNKIEEIEVFMWDIKEIRRRLLNHESPSPDIINRRMYYEGYRHFNAPNDFGGSITMRTSSDTGGALRGLGCSPGEIIGRARVILDIHKTKDLTKEDILVTIFTDPGWTPVLARVGGVITEVGGLLSHAAVIGREYGIPAILNLIDATKVIEDGDLIRMNGKSGTVEILEKGPKS